MVGKDFIAEVNKNRIPGGVWLLHGTDRYTIRKAVAACRDLADEVARELNVSELESPAITDLWSAVDALPFFSERRIVIAEKPDMDTLRTVAEHRGRVPDTTLLLFVLYGKAKKEQLNAFGDAERAVEFAPLNEADLSKFFDKRAAENGLLIGQDAKKCFLSRTGPDLASVENYIKLLSSVRTDGKPLTRAQVETYIPPVVEDKAWNLMDSFLAGNLREGIAAFENMYRDDPGSVFLILGYMVKRCGQLIEVKRMLSAKKAEVEIAAALGVKSGLSYLIRDARKLSHAQLDRTMRALCRFDRDLRQGAMSQRDAFFLALCRAFISETEEDRNA